MNPKVSIIILNWNGWKDTIECLESFYQITYPNYDVIVVDNGSENDSVEKMKEYAEGKITLESKFFEYDRSNKPIEYIEYTREEAETGGGKEDEIVDLASNRKMILIKNEKNYGFAEGANIGMRYALKALNSDYILLLNNDTVLEDKEFLTELIRVAESDEKIGIVGCKAIYPDGRIQYVGYYIAGPHVHSRLRPFYNKIWGRRSITDNDIQLDEVKEVDIVFGVAMLVKRKLIEKIGLLDSGFFPGYGEEEDWCCRAKISGFKVIYVPKAIIIHYDASTSKRLDKNYLYFIRQKNALRLHLLTYPISWLILEIPSQIMFFFGAVLHNQLKYWLKAYWINLQNLREILAKRKNRSAELHR